MRKVAVIMIAVPAICAMAATAEQLRQETYDRLQQVQAKQRALATTVYSGTWDRVLEERVADVNEVCVEITQARAAAAALMELTSDPNSIRETIQQVIREKTRQDLHEAKRGNGVFLQAVETVLADPNNTPDPNDVEEAARLADFRAAVNKLIEAGGGI